MTRVIAAAAQLACAAGDVAENVARHLGALSTARARGVDLLVFPELSLADYVSEPDPDRVALDADGPELRALAAAAGRMVAVVGFVERNGSGRPFNAAAVLDGGRVVHVHRKLNLPTYGALVEGRHYAPGTRLDLAPTRLGRLAALVCADTWNPALPWLAALAGAELLAVPVASARGAVSAGFDSRDGWAVNLRHTALTYGLPTVMANHCGRRGGLDFWGGSAVLDGRGRVVAEAGEGEELAVATLDLAEARQARAELPTVRDADPGLVARELRRSSLEAPASEKFAAFCPPPGGQGRVGRSPTGVGAGPERARPSPPPHTPDPAPAPRGGGERAGRAFSKP